MFKVIKLHFEHNENSSWYVNIENISDFCSAENGGTAIGVRNDVFTVKETVKEILHLIEGDSRSEKKEIGIDGIVPNWTKDIPFCTEGCQKFNVHKGGRCDILGYQSSGICEPMVREMVRKLT